MRIAYIMRGVPGSGKSTVARMLAGKDGVIHGTDEFFMYDGVYEFAPRRLHEYHEANFSAFCVSLRNGVPIVVNDNTNIKYWEFERYMIAAKEAGYVVAIVAMPHPDVEVAATRNTHNVPTYAIQRMIEKWEPY